MATMSLNKTIIMTRLESKKNEDLDGLVFYDDPKFRKLFPPIRTEKEFVDYIESGEKSHFTDYKIVLREMRDRYGL